MSCSANKEDMYYYYYYYYYLILIDMEHILLPAKIQVSYLHLLIVMHLAEEPDQFPRLPLVVLSELLFLETAHSLQSMPITK